MQINADLSSVETQAAFDLLPPGWYVAEVTDSEIKQSKTGNNYIKWEWSIVGKPNKVWNNMVLNNEIAMKLLKTMATALNHRNPNYIADTEELHGRKCQIKIKVVKSEGYDDKNEISGYKALENLPKETPPAFVAAAAMASTDKPAAKMPWQQ